VIYVGLLDATCDQDLWDDNGNKKHCTNGPPLYKCLMFPRELIRCESCAKVHSDATGHRMEVILAEIEVPKKKGLTYFDGPTDDSNRAPETKKAEKMF